MFVPVTPGRALQLEFEVAVTRAGRRRCSRCGARRELLRLSATANDGLIGHSTAICLACAGLRR